MYLINYDTFIQQVIPPHWRGQWQHHLIHALCSPLKQLFDDLYKYRIEALSELNHNLQVSGFEEKLNQLNGFIYPKIEVTESSENGTVKVSIPDATMQDFVRKHSHK